MSLSQHLCKKMQEHCPEAMKAFFCDLSSTTLYCGEFKVLRGNCEKGHYFLVLRIIMRFQPSAVRSFLN